MKIWVIVVLALYVLSGYRRAQKSPERMNERAQKLTGWAHSFLIRSDMNGHRHVWAQTWMGSEMNGLRNEWAQKWMGSEMNGLGNEWAQKWMGSDMNGLRNDWAQKWMGSEMNGLRNEWAQKWMGSEMNGLRNESAQKWMGSDMNGLRNDWAQKWMGSEMNGLRNEWAQKWMGSEMNGLRNEWAQKWMGSENHQNGWLNDHVLCAHTGETGPGEPPENGDVKQMALPGTLQTQYSKFVTWWSEVEPRTSRLRRPHNTESLPMGGKKHFVSLKPDYHNGRRTRKPPTWQAYGITTTLSKGSIGLLVN